MYRRHTVINAVFIRDELVWKLRLTLKQLNDLAGFGGNYIYRLLDDREGKKTAAVTLKTVDRLNAVMRRVDEIEKSPAASPSERADVRSLPLDDLWNRLIIHERIQE